MLTPTRTTPSPSAVADAMARLERAFPDLSVAEYAARYEAAARTHRQLSTSNAWMAAGEFDRMLCVQDEMLACRYQLAKAGRLDLIGEAS